MMMISLLEKEIEEVGPPPDNEKEKSSSRIPLSLVRSLVASNAERNEIRIDRDYNCVGLFINKKLYAYCLLKMSMDDDDNDEMEASTEENNENAVS